MALVLSVSGLLIVADQLIKIWILGNLAGQPSILVIPHLLQLTYVENRGAAFGVLQGRTWLLSAMTAVVLIVILVLLLSGKIRNKLAVWSLGLIIAGGAGNLIDRIMRGFVVDYLDISPLFSFPVFNLADCCVVIGTFALMFYLLRAEDGKKKITEEPIPTEPAEPNEEA